MIATRTKAEMAIQIWVFTAFSVEKTKRGRLKASDDFFGNKGFETRTNVGMDVQTFS